MWITRRMWEAAQAKIDERLVSIAKRVTVLNHEYGRIETTVKLNTKLIGVIILGLLGIAWFIIQRGLGV